MTNCFFVSDLHGNLDRYEKLFNQIKIEKPDAVFLGGDLLPHSMKIVKSYNDFILDFLFPKLYMLEEMLKDQYPEIFLILGNDDARSEEIHFLSESRRGLFNYINQQKVQFKDYQVIGYSFIPPSPFQLKDWEKYDVSRYVDPGCTHPTEGFRTLEPEEDIEYSTIKIDLEELVRDEELSKTIFLFHSPPYKTKLDRAALDDVMIDHVPMDVHVGSIAIKRFIEDKQPLLTLHGHIHESTKITGSWNEQIGSTYCFNAATDDNSLSIIKFNIEELGRAIQILI